MKESDLYEPIKRFFEEEGYMIYSEVEVPYASGRVDVIAYNYPCAVAIELKTSLTIELIDQAVARKSVFPYVWIAIPQRKKHIARWLQQYLKDQKIGILQVNNRGYVKAVQPARYHKPPLRNMIDWKTLLREEHKTWLEGGSSGGGYVTPYKLTIAAVKKYLEGNKGWVTINDVLNHCETHYRSPKPSLSKALREFETDWCESKKEKGRLYFKCKNSKREVNPLYLNKKRGE